MKRIIVLLMVSVMLLSGLSFADTTQTVEPVAGPGDIIMTTMDNGNDWP